MLVQVYSLQYFSQIYFDVNKESHCIMNLEKITSKRKLAALVKRLNKDSATSHKDIIKEAPGEIPLVWVVFIDTSLNRRDVWKIRLCARKYCEGFFMKESDYRKLKKDGFKTFEEPTITITY
jgi:hypothetical protein